MCFLKNKVLSRDFMPSRFQELNFQLLSSSIWLLTETYHWWTIIGNLNNNSKHSVLTSTATLIVIAACSSSSLDQSRRRRHKAPFNGSVYRRNYHACQSSIRQNDSAPYGQNSILTERLLLLCHGGSFFLIPPDTKPDITSRQIFIHHIWLCNELRFEIRGCSHLSLFYEHC